MADTEKKEQEQKPVAPERNGIRRPRAGTMTGRVWEIADEISEAKGEPAQRKEVIDVYVDQEGGNPSTCTTQFGRWRKFHGLTGANAPGRRAKVDADTEEAEVESDD